MARLREPRKRRAFGVMGITVLPGRSAPQQIVVAADKMRSNHPRDHLPGDGKS